MKKTTLSLFIALSFIGCNNFRNGNVSKTKELKDSTVIKSAAVSEESKKEAREKLEAIRQRVLNGESMTTLATLYSEDSGTKKTGGEYDRIARGQFVPEFETVAFNLKPGEISEVFETQYGFHFVQLIAHHAAVVDVRHILVIPK